ncbi:MAG: PglZ domain-containing protein [Anaerolineaceae bacterium]|nr:PglZ domain-containing protein [Anaerolineaceae bacterium]
MKLAHYISHLLTQKLESCRILVWYDADRMFEPFVHQFILYNCTLIFAKPSPLTARKSSDDAFRTLLQSGGKNMLIYYPSAHPTGDARLQDPFEIYTALGDTFGDNESELLKSLALQAMPEFSEQIERLFREGKPTLEMLDRLEQTTAYPLIHQALGTESAVDVSSALIADPEVRQNVADLPGCLQEVQRLVQHQLGFDLLAQPKDSHWYTLGQYVLFSELLLDLNIPIPPALAGLARAGQSAREMIFSVADRLRETRHYQEAYLELASTIETNLHLDQHFAGVKELGQRDTFAFEERQFLQSFIQNVEAGRIEQARHILVERRDSIWRQQPERAQLWAVAERCLNLLDQADQAAEAITKTPKFVTALISAYTAEKGWNELDNRQRLMEQSIADCAQTDELEGCISNARNRYRQVMNQIQKLFLDTLEVEGWPPENILRQSQVFDRLIAPALANREKVAYFLADALRFEMGRDLAQALVSVGSVEMSSLAASLPTITSVGMAALLPGADGALELREIGDDLVPFIGERRLKNLPERLSYLQERYGDRMVSVEISEFLSLTTAAQREKKLKNADLVIVRDSRIDSMGETVPLREARRYMSDLLGDLKTAALQMARLGYCYQVITADHGHVLLPEILPGDVVASTPNGDWTWSKRRFLLGRQVRESAGTRVFNARKLGMSGDISELVVPNGFGVYSAGSGYFHGGLSLQECILPLIVLRANPPTTAGAPEEVRLSYRNPQFTSRVLGIKAWFNSLLTPSIRVRIEVYDGAGVNAHKVGDAAECDARDDVTHEITLSAGQEIQIPVLIDADFNGQQVELRAIQAETAVILSRLTLKNAMME